MIKERISLKLVKEIEEDVFRLCTSVEQRKKILSPHKESNLRPLDSTLITRRKAYFSISLPS